MEKKRCDPKITNDCINPIFEFLKGWKLAPEIECDHDEYSTSFIEKTEIDDTMNTSNVVIHEKIEIFFQK